MSDIPCPDPFGYHDGAGWYIFGTGAEHFLLQGKALVPREMGEVALHLDHSHLPSLVAQIWGFIVYRHRDASHHA